MPFVLPRGDFYEKWMKLLQDGYCASRHLSFRCAIISHWFGWLKLTEFTMANDAQHVTAQRMTQ
jgi:hypothetical protein